MGTAPAFPTAAVLQPALSEAFSPRGLRVHKCARQTARAVYAAHRARDKAKAAAGRETREGQVLRLLAWHWNVTQASPTALELLAWARQHGEPLFDVNSLRPRLTALVRAGIVEPRAKRSCSMSGKRVWTWAVREIGSAEPR